MASGPGPSSPVNWRAKVEQAAAILPFLFLWVDSVDSAYAEHVAQIGTAIAIFF